MGMTDKQFNAFVRFLLDDMEEIEAEENEEKKAKKIHKVIEHLRDTLED